MTYTGKKIVQNFTFYRDLTDEGPQITVYKNGRCIGTYLEDDAELVEMMGKDAWPTAGIDNRTKGVK